jgi:hypothetical protein
LISTVLCSSSKDDDGRGEDVVTIYHIDTVVGRVVSRTRHKNAQGPVSAVLCENWAVYHYWSLERAGRWELGVVELYEGSESILGVEKVVNVFRGSTEKEAFDSYSARQPQVARKTAVFPHAVNQDAMTVTQTRYGVTLRHVLMGLGSGELYSLDKRMIDPRAPVNQKPPLTQDEAEGECSTFSDHNKTASQTDWQATAARADPDLSRIGDMCAAAACLQRASCHTRP